MSPSLVPTGPDARHLPDRSSMMAQLHLDGDHRQKAKNTNVLVGGVPPADGGRRGGVPSST